MSATVVSNSCFTALGYVVTANQDGLLIWSKKDGGSLVFASYHVSGFPPPTMREDSYLPMVSVKMTTASATKEGPHFTVAPYECTHLVLVSDVMRTLFPLFSGGGVMATILGLDSGAMMTIIYTHQAPRSFYRPVPKCGESVYCPPWSFADAKSMSEWENSCILFTHNVIYEYRIVYIRDRYFAYDCRWIALAVRKTPLPLLISNFLPWAPGIEDDRKRRLAKYNERKMEVSKLSAWDKAKCLQSAQARVNGTQAVPNLDENNSNFIRNCDAVRRFLRKYPNNGNCGNDQPVLHSAYRGKIIIDIGAQTDWSAEVFKELKFWLRDMSAAFSPKALDEFCVRVSPLHRKFK